MRPFSNHDTPSNPRFSPFVTPGRTGRADDRPHELASGHSLQAPPPRQRRSRQTEAAILEAALGLLETRDLNQISLAEIADEASISQGTLHGRFRTKAALLHRLHEAYCREFEAESKRLLTEILPAQRSYGDRIRTAVEAQLRHLLRKRGAVRNFRRAGLDDPRFAARQRRLDQAQLRAFVDFFLRHHPRHGTPEAPKPEIGERLCRMVLASLRDGLDTGALSELNSDSDIRAEAQALTDFCLRILID